MLILGVETSCDETAVSVVEIIRQTGNEKITVLSNVISSQVKLHAKYGGVVPNLASREHAKNIKHVFTTAIKEAAVRNFKNGIDLIAVTYGPGLGPALLVGLMFSKTLAWKFNKPIIGVNHLEGHIYSNWIRDSITDSKLAFNNKIFPILNLIVSGGHTELVMMSEHGKYNIIGETQDDAIGEAFDKVARLLGFGYPGGPIISKIAEKGDPTAYPLPSPMLKTKNYNFSYSGLKTAVLYLLRDLKLKKLSTRTKADIAASFQNAAIEVLIAKTIRAAKEYKVKTIMLSGGVSANSLLRKRLNNVSVKNGINFSCPQMKYTTDNAVMIAVAGYFATRKKKKINLNWRLIEMNANLTL